MDRLVKVLTRYSTGIYFGKAYRGSLGCCMHISMDERKFCKIPKGTWISIKDKKDECEF